MRTKIILGENSRKSTAMGSLAFGEDAKADGELLLERATGLYLVLNTPKGT
jgi:hypothetical protein